MLDRPPRIAVCGAGTADAALERVAEEVGRRIAEAGGVVICGGLGGVMAAAARGAAAAGGLTIGLLPGPEAAGANPHIRIPLPTGLGEARNALVARTAGAVIAIGGEWGTVSEIAFARKVGVPVILLSASRMTFALASFGLEIAPSPEVAVRRALELAGGGGRPA